MPKLYDLVPFHSGQVGLLVLGVWDKYKVKAILYFIFDLYL